MARGEASEGTLKAIGERLRRVRLQRHMSLRDVATAAGLSPSFVSLVERGETEIAISRLIRLADACGVVLIDLLDTVRDPAVEFVPAEQGRHVPRDDDGVEVIYLASPSWSMQPFKVELGPGATLDSLAHPTEEFVHCVSGLPTMTVLGEERQLRPGDTLVLPAFAEHTYGNRADEPAVLVGAVRRPEPAAQQPARRRRTVQTSQATARTGEPSSPVRRSGKKTKR